MTKTSRWWMMSAVVLCALPAFVAGQSLPGNATRDRPRSAAPAAPAQTQTAPAMPERVYVPYEQLRSVFQNSRQGVFLPYEEFQRLWQAARRAPAGVERAPLPYLISVARLQGQVGQELASLQLELTVDVLVDGWIEVPLGLREVAVTQAAFGAAEGEAPLLRVQQGQYYLVTRGQGRRTLTINFVRQIQAQPGLNVLSFGLPSAAITTLELLIPEENMRVDVEPQLAATTSQVAVEGKPSTRLQAFLGSSESVKLSWKPKTQAAEDLEPVVVSEQLQHINVQEAVISHTVQFNYDVRRRGVDNFVVQLPPDFRVVSVDGANIARWDVQGGPGTATAPAAPAHVLEVKLFAPVKGAYTLTVKMERFLQEPQVTLPLSPVVTRQALRETGLIALSHSPRRSVELRQVKNLARVDAGKLPEYLRQPPAGPQGPAAAPPATAWRFVSADYSAQLAIASVAPRLSATCFWALGVDTDRLELLGRLEYEIERAGVFELSVELPAGWELVSVAAFQDKDGATSVLEDHRLSGQGPRRVLTALLKREVLGRVRLELALRRGRASPTEDVNLDLPLPVAGGTGVPVAAATVSPAAGTAATREGVAGVSPASDGAFQRLSGQVVLYRAPALRPEVVELRQLQSRSLAGAAQWPAVGGAPGPAGALTPALALEFQAIDRARPAGASFRIAVQPPQVSAVVHRLVNLQPGMVEQEAVVQYRVQNAPVDTFYLKMAADLADRVRISGANIKEQPRIQDLPPDQQEKPAASAPASTLPAATTSTAPQWAYFKIVLQAPVMGGYQLHVNLREALPAGQPGQSARVEVLPIVAAGKLSDQNGHIAVAKAENLAIGQPQMQNLTVADPGSGQDLPYEPHRNVAALAFKWTTPQFSLALPVVWRQEADVYTRIVTAAVIEQVIDRRGTLNTHAAWLVSSSRGDRLAITLPPRAKLFGVLVNGAEAAVEAGAAADERIVRLPPSAGQTNKNVVEVSFGLDGASAAALPAPSLPSDTPVQQTFWRLYVPKDDYVLRHDPGYWPLADYQMASLVSQASNGYPAPVNFKLAPQGRQWDFVRQGPPGKLSLTLVRREWFNLAVWAVLLAAGAVMLKLSWWSRTLLVLLAAAAVAAISLFWPPLSKTLARAALAPAGLVLLLWFGQTLFVIWPRRRRERAATRQPPPKRPPLPIVLPPESEVRPERPDQPQGPSSGSTGPSKE